MNRPPILWSPADLLDVARAAEALGALSFQMAERFGPDHGLDLSCRVMAALLDRVLRDATDAALRHAIRCRLEGEAKHLREMRERTGQHDRVGHPLGQPPRS